MFGRVNKISFFLWSTRTEKFTKDGEVVVFMDDNGNPKHQSGIDKTHPVEIFILKLLPAWVLFGFLVHIPNIKYIFLGLVITVLSFAVLFYAPKYFKKFLIVLSAVGLFFVIPSNGMELPFEQIVYVVAMILLFGFLAKETYSLIYEDDYFFLENVNVSINVKGTRTRPGKKKLFNKIPFLGLASSEKRVSLGTMSFSGYYLKVKKDAEEELND